MTNLDRFSQPSYGETYFDDEKAVCECSQCKDDLFKGDDIVRYSDEVFCSKDCCINWILEADHAEEDTLGDE